jgi:hypothetical protein
MANKKNAKKELLEEFFNCNDILANQIEKVLRTGGRIHINKSIMRGYSDEYDTNSSLSYLEMNFKTLSLKVKSKKNDNSTRSKRFNA